MKSNILGNNIRLLRENYPISQLEFAKLLNISNSALSQYESGNRMPNDEIKLKIADFFGVSVDFLLGRENLKNERNNPKNNTIIDEIENLSPASKEELKKYIQLLKLKDTMDKSKDEMSSPLMPNVSKNK